MKRLLLVIAALILSVDIWACTTAVVSAGASADGRPMLWKQRDAPDPYNVIAHIKGGKYAFTALFPTKAANTPARPCFPPKTPCIPGRTPVSTRSASAL